MQRKVKDLTGQHFGSWTVIERVPTRYGNTAFWLCRCQCGTLFDIPGATLRNGESLGCKYCNSRRRKTFKDLTGQSFGGWTVLTSIPPTEVKHNNLWLAKCGCGKEQDLSTTRLKRAKKGCSACSRKTNEAIRYRPFEALYLKAMRSAKRDGHNFTITYEEFLSVKADICHYCNAPLKWADFCVSKNGQGYNLDRMNNNLGYITGNVVSCCKRCNIAKGNRFTYEEWHGMTAYLRNQ